MPLSEQQLAYALANRDEVRREIELQNAKEDAEARLVDFVRMMWLELHPEAEPLRTGWVIDCLCDHLQAITEGDINKLIINFPPGMGKTLYSGVLWPAWEWGPKNMPWRQHLNFSYAERLTIDANVKFRTLIESDSYQEAWGDVFSIREDMNNKLKLGNDRHGFKFASSVGGTATGARGHVVVLDDPINPEKVLSDVERAKANRFQFNTLPTRVNNRSEAAFLLIMQRLHQNDNTGVALAKKLGYQWLCLAMEFEHRYRAFTVLRPRWIDDPEPVHVKQETTVKDPIPFWVECDEDDEDAELLYCQDPRTEEGELLFPEFMEQPEVDDLKNQLSAVGGDFAVAGQLQQRPFDLGGGLFKEEYFCQFLDSPGTGGRVVRGWDLAGTDSKTSPWTVGAKWRLDDKGRLILEDISRFRCEAGDVDDRVAKVAERDGAEVRQSIPQDPGAAGKAWRRYLTAELQGHDLHFSPESGSKLMRALPLAAQVKGGNVWLVRAPWNDLFIAEVCSFPGGTYKDQVDASSRAYAAILTMPKKRKPTGGWTFAING